MKNWLTFLLLLFTFFGNAQEVLENSSIIDGDDIEYNKSTKISEERTFTTPIKDKYTSEDFVYTEEKPKKKAKKKDKETADNSSGLFSLFIYFMTSIFPFLLGGFVIFIIIKVLLGSDFRLWNSNIKSQKLSEKLVYEDEDIHEVNLNKLLQEAIENKDFRLAIRYYYLSTLKTLSNNQLIDYHKDKTNSEYLFEIENKTMRTNFSYLSYIYSYVWYGEFPVDETNFKVAENKYQSFLKSLV